MKLEALFEDTSTKWLKFFADALKAELSERCPFHTTVSTLTAGPWGPHVRATFVPNSEAGEAVDAAVRATMRTTREKLGFFGLRPVIKHALNGKTTRIVKLEPILKEEASPLLKKIVLRIKNIINGINYEYRKSAEIDFDLFRRVVVDEDERGAYMMVFMDSNASDSDHEGYEEVLNDALEEEGIINGAMPVQATIKRMGSEANALIIRFNRG